MMWTLDEDDWEFYHDDACEPGVRISLIQNGHVLVFRLTHKWSFCFKRQSALSERYLSETTGRLGATATTMPSNWVPA
jgi:hypothetical protein